MFQSDRIAKLEEQIKLISGERDQAKEALASLEKVLAEQKTELTKLEELSGKVSTLEADKVSLTTDLTRRTQENADLQKKLDADAAAREQTIRTQVNERAAAAGIQPVKRDPAAVDPLAKDPLTGPGAKTTEKGLSRATALLAEKMAANAPAKA